MFFTQLLDLHCFVILTVKNSVHLNSNIWPFFVQVNPFKDRICKVFSSSKDGELTFEDFLDMMSVFSENVSLQKINFLKTTICYFSMYSTISQFN